MRSFAFTYTQLQQIDWDTSEQNEFGYATYIGTWHKRGDMFVCAYHGRRIIELLSDDKAFLVFGKRHTAGARGRWERFLNSRYELNTKRITSASGLQRYKVGVRIVHTPIYLPAQYLVETHNRILVTTAGDKLKFEPWTKDEPTVLKDNAAYRAFNKKLKGLAATLIAQAKLGVYSQLMSSNYRGANQYSELRKLGEQMKLEKNYPFAVQTELVRRWVQSEDVSLLNYIAKAVAYNHRDDNHQESAEQRMVRRIKSAMRHEQVRYLRDNCVKMVAPSATSSTEDESTDTDCELLENAGLREVQAPCEA